MSTSTQPFAKKGAPMGQRKRLRVLMVGPVPPPVGGMATVVENLVTALKSHCEVKVLNNVKTTPEDRSLLEAIIAQLGLLLRLGWLIVKWRPHVVHIHTCSYMTFWRNGADVLLAKLFGRKVALHIHGGRFHKFLTSFGGVQKLLARLIFGVSDTIIVLGETWKLVLGKWCTPDKLVVVPNGIPVTQHFNQFRNSHRSKEKQPEILCVAHYDQRKGQRQLLQAIARLTDPASVNVTLMGPETQAGEQKHLEQLAQALGLQRQVTITGPILGDAKQPFLDRADLFCLPSEDEGLPMAMLEAMAQGLPVVATRVGSIPEVVSDGQEGRLYLPGDVDELTQRLQELLATPERLKIMGHAARERVLNGFSLDASVNKLLVLYLRMIDE